MKKQPILYIVKMCCICNADLRYLNEIHRIDMKWYCDKCYKKYKVK